MSLNKQFETSDLKAFAFAKRKTAIAKVNIIKNGTGKITIITGNSKKYVKKTASEYFQDKFLINDLIKPLAIIKKDSNFDVEAFVSGGGFSGQAAAIKLSIAKAILKLFASLKPELKVNRFLKHDTRRKERKKIGKYGARRSPQFTKR